MTSNECTCQTEAEGMRVIRDDDCPVHGLLTWPSVRSFVFNVVTYWLGDIRDRIVARYFKRKS
jgi:hypothetical protein